MAEHHLRIASHQSTSFLQIYRTEAFKQTRNIARVQVPAWPFVCVSFATGIFALWPYFIVCQLTTQVESPPPQSELQSGFGRFAMRALESKWLPALNLITVLVCFWYAVSTGWDGLEAYYQFFRESKFVHVTTIDFALLAIFTPFFMSWDAERRGWASRTVGVPALSVLPLIGPCIYLLMRPSTSLQKGEGQVAAEQQQQQQ